MKILYLTFFESVTNNGIYESQVKELLCKLAARHPGEIEITQAAILPAFVAGRDGIASSIISEGHKRRALEQDFLQKGVSAKFIFVPVVVLKRWLSHPPWPVLFLVFLLSLPVLFYQLIRKQYDIIHCRSYIATLYALVLKSAFKNVKVVFDPRGFYPEEGVVHGRWSEHSLTFGIWKWVEKRLVTRCDRVIALSDTFEERISQIANQAQCCVIYAGAALERFLAARQSRESKRKELGMEGKVVFVYNGSLGSWHDPYLLAKVCAQIRRAVAHSTILVITRYQKEKLVEMFGAAGLNHEDYTIVAASPDEVAAYLSAGDFGIVPARDTNASAAAKTVSDTMIGLKVAEYLASGLPIIVNKNVGGLKSLMERHRIGIFFDSRKLGEIAQGIRQMQASCQQYQSDCELVARRYFSLDRTAQLYYQLYANMLGIGKVGVAGTAALEDKHVDPENSAERVSAPVPHNP